MADLIVVTLPDEPAWCDSLAGTAAREQLVFLAPFEPVPDALRDRVGVVIGDDLPENLGDLPNLRWVQGRSRFRSRGRRLRPG